MNIQKETTSESPHLLPQNPTEALAMMTRLTEQVLAIMKEETRALENQELSYFYRLQEQKITVSNNYSAAAIEFQARQEDFKEADINRLVRATEGLRNVSRDNVQIIESMVSKMSSEQNKNNNLFLLQMQMQNPADSTAYTATE